MEKVENAKVLEVLCAMDIGKLKDDRANNQIITAHEITVQKTFCLLLSCGLNQYAYSLHRNLDRLSSFDKKYMFFIKWCEKIEDKIKHDFTGSPDSAIRKLKVSMRKIAVLKEY